MKKYFLLTQLITLFTAPLFAGDSASVIEVLKQARNDAPSKEAKTRVTHALDAAVRVVNKARRYDDEQGKNEALENEVAALREENRKLSAKAHQLEKRLARQQQSHVEQLTQLEQYITDHAAMHSAAANTPELAHDEPAAA